MARIWRRRRMIILGVVLALLAVAFVKWQQAIRKNRSIPDEPFRIAGNLYYVGSTGVTSFLLTGPEGHVVIDGGYPETAPLIMGSIAKLGFDIADVKVLLNTHAHSDHAGGLRELQEASGAELWISEPDAEAIVAGGHAIGPFRYLEFLGFGKFAVPRIDHRFTDGDTIRLGPIELTAHITAGHTPGCTSWSFPVQDGDRTLLAVDICSLTLLPFTSLTEPETYPGIREDFEHSFSMLRSLPADIFLASHSSWFHLEDKRRARADAADPVEPFIDRAGYLGYIDRSEAWFQKKLADQQ